MSAAEKLKTLDFGTTVDDAEVISMGYEALLALRDALPQILAVVEAAAVVGDELDTWEPTERNRARLHNALLALDEKLSRAAP